MANIQKCWGFGSFESSGTGFADLYPRVPEDASNGIGKGDTDPTQATHICAQGIKVSTECPAFMQNKCNLGSHPCWNQSSYLNDAGVLTGTPATNGGASPWPGNKTVTGYGGSCQNGKNKSKQHCNDKQKSYAYCSQYNYAGTGSGQENMSVGTGSGRSIVNEKWTPAGSYSQMTIVANEPWQQNTTSIYACVNATDNDTSNSQGAIAGAGGFWATAYQLNEFKYADQVKNWSTMWSPNVEQSGVPNTEDKPTCPTHAEYGSGFGDMGKNLYDTIPARSDWSNDFSDTNWEAFDLLMMNFCSALNITGKSCLPFNLVEGGATAEQYPSLDDTCCSNMNINGDEGTFCRDWFISIIKRAKTDQALQRTIAQNMGQSFCKPYDSGTHKGGGVRQMSCRTNCPNDNDATNPLSLYDNVIFTQTETSYSAFPGSSDTTCAALGFNVEPGAAKTFACGNPVYALEPFVDAVAPADTLEVAAAECLCLSKALVPQYVYSSLAFGYINDVNTSSDWWLPCQNLYSSCDIDYNSPTPPYFWATLNLCAHTISQTVCNVIINAVSENGNVYVINNNFIENCTQTSGSQTPITPPDQSISSDDPTSLIDKIKQFITKNWGYIAAGLLVLIGILLYTAKTNVGRWLRGQPPISDEPNPQSKATQENKPASKSESEPAPKPASKSQSKPAPKPASKQASKPAPAPAPKPASKPVPKKSAFMSFFNKESAANSKPEPAPKPAKPEPAPKSAPKPAPKPAKTEPKPVSKQASKPVKEKSKVSTKPGEKSKKDKKPNIGAVFIVGFIIWLVIIVGSLGGILKQNNDLFYDYICREPSWAWASFLCFAYVPQKDPNNDAYDPNYY